MASASLPDIVITLWRSYELSVYNLKPAKMGASNRDAVSRVASHGSLYNILNVFLQAKGVELCIYLIHMEETGNSGAEPADLAYEDIKITQYCLNGSLV